MEKMSYNRDKTLLINETFIIDHGINEQWYQLVFKELIPEMKKSGLVQNVILSKIHGNFNPDGENYALQFKVNAHFYQEFKDHKIIKDIRYKMDTRFKNKFGSFKTELLVMID